MSTNVNQTLTNYARGLSQDLTAGKLAEFLAPSVIVPAAVGKYKTFADANDFQAYDTARAIGTDPNRIVFAAGDGDYNCKPHALEVTIDKYERDGYGDGDPLGIEQLKVRSLLSSTALAVDLRAIAAAKTLAAVGSVGVWIGTPGKDNDPIAEIDAQIAAIATTTGQMPNRMVIGLPVWQVLRSHPKVLARFPGALLVGLTASQFASLLLNPAIEIKIGMLSSNTGKPGSTVNKVNIAGSEVFIFSASAAPSQYDPSFMKTFKTRTGSVESVRTYTAPNGLYDGVIVDWSEDIQVTSSACARRITVS